MKKLAVFFVTATLILGLAGCGNRSGENEGSGTDSGQGSSVTDSALESGPETQTESDSESRTGAEEEASQAPQEGISEQMSAVRQAVVDVLGDNYWPDTLIPPEFLEGYGLTSDMYDDFFGEMPMISANVDTLIIIRAREGQIDAVEEVLNSYRDVLVNDTLQYPMNVGVVQASRIEVTGDYACFVQLGADTSKLMDAGDEEIIRHCQELNEMALEAIERAIRQ